MKWRKIKKARKKQQITSIKRHQSDDNISNHTRVVYGEALRGMLA